MNGLRALKRIALVKLLPATDAACLDANHIFPAIFGLKVTEPGGLCNMGVPNDDVVEVVADNAQAQIAIFVEDNGLLRSTGRGVYAVVFARKCNTSRLLLGGVGFELVDVRGAVKAVERNFGNILNLVSFICLYRRRGTIVKCAIQRRKDLTLTRKYV